MPSFVRTGLRHLPLVALTAHAMSGDRERFLQCGFDSYVAKPIIDERELQDTIAALLHQARGEAVEQWWQTPTYIFAPPELAGPF